MISLPQTKRWTGDGFGDAGARIFTLLKRTEKVALYKRTVESSGASEGFELFLIKMRHKGDKLPGGQVEADDREVYPSANSFGRTAWHIYNLPYAEARFQELNDKANGIVHEETESEPETPEENEAESEAPKHRGRPKRELPTFTLPDGEFSVKELAASNGVEYVVAYQFVKQEEGKTVMPTRSERRAARGKETQLYKKV